VRDSQESWPGRQQPQEPARGPELPRENQKPPQKAAFPIVACLRINRVRRRASTQALQTASTSSPPSPLRWQRDKPTVQALDAKHSSRVPPGFRFRYPLPETAQFHVSPRDAGQCDMFGDFFLLFRPFTIGDCDPVITLHRTHPLCCVRKSI
jgi:hypothetical protein